MALNNFNRLIILAAAALPLLAACDQAVMVSNEPPYIIKGDRHSALYPLLVKRDGEDVRIELNLAAPVPEIFSIDAAGHAIAFNFTKAGNEFIVPGKFEHLRLLHAGAATVDILGEEKVAMSVQ